MAEINVTPLVDVMLVLLIIFMVTANFIVRETVEVDLPRAANAGETPQGLINVVMDKDAGKMPLPSDFLLQQMGQPWLHYLFQAMIFAALLESGTSAVHAINERIGHAWQARRGSELSHRARLTIGLVLLAVCMFAAGRFGLVALIASGYRAIAYVFLAVFVLPLMTIGVWKILRNERAVENVVLKGEIA